MGVSGMSSRSIDSLGGFQQYLQRCRSQADEKWSTKSYDFTPAEPIPFPQPLAKMCSGIVQQIPWDEVYDGVQEAPDGYDQWARDYGMSASGDDASSSFRWQDGTLML